MIEPVDPTVSLLRDVPQWTLPPALWQEVDEILQQVDQALRAGNTVGARAAASVLSLCGPHRVSRSVNENMGEVERAGVSNGTRDLVNELVHRLAPLSAEAGRIKEDAGRHAAVPE